MFSCEFCEISKNTLFNRTPPVAAFEDPEAMEHFSEKSSAKSRINYFHKNALSKCLASKCVLNMHLLRLFGMDNLFTSS